MLSFFHKLILMQIHFMPHIMYQASLHTGSSKSALDMLTKVMALELGPHKVNNHKLIAWFFVQLVGRLVSRLRSQHSVLGLE